MADRNERSAELAQLPGWIRILPLGKVELSDSREPFEVDAASLAGMVAAFRSRGVDLVIDYEHQSLQGERAPAAGWIKDLEARPDGLWAKVEWTRQAREYLLSKEYRYFSPVLRLDPETRRPTALLHLGLTNVPAIKRLPPLVAKWGGEAGMAPAAIANLGDQGQAGPSPASEKGRSMDKIKKLLGLAPQADEGMVASRVLEIWQDLAAALGLPAEASVSQVKGAVAALQAGAASLREHTEELMALKARLAAESATRAVDEALLAGKVSPAQKEWALEYFRRDPEGFATYVARAPKLVPVGEFLSLRGEDRGATDLLPEELAICRSLNLAPEAYLKAKGKAVGI